MLLHAHSRPEAVEALAATIRAAGGQAECLVFDLTSDDAAAAACARMLAGGPVQIVVNNAGIHDDAVFPGMKRGAVAPVSSTSRCTASSASRSR